MGLFTPFRTGLCIYADDNNICTTAVDRIIQKTFISLNEQGVEAAAVTAIIGRNFPIYPDNSTLMLVDHPFQFFLHDRDTGVVLFEGRVVLPEVQENDDAPTTTNHTTDAYWENQFRVTTLNRVVLDPFIATRQRNCAAAESACIEYVHTVTRIMPTWWKGQKTAR